MGELAAKLREHILVLAREAGSFGLTINEAAEQIPGHKPWSISPRFAELRHYVGVGKPTKRFPAGRPRYATRYDARTKRNVRVHWLPEFAEGLPESAAQLRLNFCKIVAQRKQPKSTKRIRRVR
jgi:hypothetical protein